MGVAERNSGQGKILEDIPVINSLGQDFKYA